MDSISYHSKMFQYYKYRMPYVDELFVHMVEYLKLNDSSVLIDLCCGSGEISSRLARYVKKIHAVDGSREMLSLAPSIKNVQYYCVDICKSVLGINDISDHLIIGKAIHWLDKNSLSNIVNNNLNKDGKVVIVFNQNERTAWSEQVNSVMNKFGRKSFGHDFTGKYLLNSIGYVEENRIIVESTMTSDLNWLVLQLISLAYGDAFENIINNFSSFREEIFRIMCPYTQDGIVSRKFYNIALIYKIN